VAELQVDYVVPLYFACMLCVYSADDGDNSRLRIHHLRRRHCSGNILSPSVSLLRDSNIFDTELPIGCLVHLL